MRPAGAPVPQPAAHHVCRHRRGNRWRSCLLSGAGLVLRRQFPSSIGEFISMAHPTPAHPSSPPTPPIGAMAKYAPFLHSAAPNVPLLSPGYCATEGVVGLAASLLEHCLLLPPHADGKPHVPHAACGEVQRAANEWKAAGAGVFTEGAQEAYVLLPHISAFYEFLPMGGGAPCT